jgi:glycosyltransferase involved in cell wall biosynthesis
VRPRVAIVTDTIDDTNGVALGLRRLADAAHHAGHAVQLIGPAATRPVASPPAAVRPVASDDRVVRLPAAMSATLPFYADMTWSVPELPALISHLAEHADLVQVSTPGPMGIAGLVAARMLGLPLVAQYHTEVADYAARMTGLAMLRGLVEPFVGWFYRQADLCLAPSRAVAERLAAIGVPDDRICRVARGVDLDLFHPDRRDRGVLAAHGIADTQPVALYVGRLSPEKNLAGLMAAWREVHAARPDARLLVVGDGPRADLVAGPGVVAVGPLFDEALASVFASADVFTFASETETFGNVVIEAAASGLPAVVAPGGAAHEHVIAGVTGEIAPPGELAAALLRLLDDPPLRRRMGRAARAHAEGYGMRRAVRETWAIYASIEQASTSLEQASTSLEQASTSLVSAAHVRAAS